MFIFYNIFEKIFSYIFIHNQHLVYSQHKIILYKDFMLSVDTTDCNNITTVYYNNFIQRDPQFSNYVTHYKDLKKNTFIQKTVRYYYIFKDLNIRGLLYSPYETKSEVTKRINAIGILKTRSIWLPGRGARMSSIEFWSSED